MLVTAVISQRSIKFDLLLSEIKIYDWQICQSYYLNPIIRLLKMPNSCTCECNLNRTMQPELLT